MFKKASANRKALLLLGTAVNVVAFSLHSFLVHICYQINYAGLLNAANRAVRDGVSYLPADPGTAIQVAARSLRLAGVPTDEIVFTRVIPNDHTLTISLKQRLPIYMTLLAVGLPSHEISVTVSASIERTGMIEAALKYSSRLRRDHNLPDLYRDWSEAPHSLSLLKTSSG